MPRGPRISFENAFFHVYNRGINRQKIFLEEDDYIKFLKRLEELKTKNCYDHSIYTYILMPNHFHLLIQAKKDSVSKIMTSLLTSYSMYFNRKYRRVGTLFQNRFKSKLCDKDSYFLGASRYIHLNPIKDGLVKDLSDYPWTSYREVFGNSPFKIVDSIEVMRLIGESEQDKKHYLKFLLSGIDNLEDLSSEYSFDREVEIEGDPRFTTLSQKKYLRRRKKSIVSKTV